MLTTDAFTLAALLLQRHVNTRKRAFIRITRAEIVGFIVGFAILSVIVMALQLGHAARRGIG